ncbi:MAG TPA: hypothetical protein EYQ18_19830 [Candidatus Handelsmanbacteria bacterium]|nr:hypothetical protein [Candidatus Handelsmanbacteria bacterium]
MARSLIAAKVLLIALALAPQAHGSEVFTVGGDERGWSGWGDTPGGVIAFVDRLGDVQNPAGNQVFAGVADSLSGWIMPLRLNPDFNISLDVFERGGDIDVPNLARSEKDPEELAGVLNGDHRVAYDRKFVAGRIVRNNGVAIRIDLGARFGMDRIVFYPRMTDLFPFDNEFMRGYELFLNDGLPQNLFASGQPIFTSPVLREPDNREVKVDVQIEPQFVRFVELKSISTLGFEVDEIEIYGRGFVPTARYVSNVLDLGEKGVWGSINWAEALTGGAENSKVEVRVRSGMDETPDIYYRSVAVNGVRQLTPIDSKGDTLTQEIYEKKLSETERGPIRVDAANWSQWQLVANGTELNLPAPRRYFQFSIDFANRTLDASRAIADLGFEFERPPVDRIVAEIDPPRTRVGEQTAFTYVARVANTTGRAGFVRFEVETPARVAAIRKVEILDAENNRLDGAEFADGMLDGVLPVRAGDFSIEEVEDDHFTLGVPLIAADGTLLKIEFAAAVFRYGTRFQGRAFADANTLIPMQTEGGDATPELDTNELLVRVTVGSQVAGPLQIEPAVFTPNGDGINDEAAISYTVLHLLEPSLAEVNVYDLAGRRICQLSAAMVQNGRVPLSWDGRGTDGGLVIPGVYLLQVEIHSDRGIERRAGSVAVVY